MPVRRLTLEEWFLAYQLRHLVRGRMHLPSSLEVDVSAIAALYDAEQRRPAWPAILVKAYAAAAVRVPAVNRAYLRTFFGERMIDFDHVTVNLPVLIEEKGRFYGAVTWVRNADRLSVSEIARALKDAKQMKLDDTKLTKIVARGKNNIFMRTFLRIVHFLAYNLPGQFEKRGGGLSVSALPNYHADGPRFIAPSYGPTAVTLCLTDVRRMPDGRTIMLFGCGLDHCAVDGLTVRLFIDALHEILSAKSPETLQLLS